MIGRILDQRYELTSFIGKGGMALVYKAKDKRTGHDVAVKILRPEFNKDEEFLSRFDREAMTASKMSHHNIVNLLDVGQEGDLRYLVMEYVKGKTLKAVIHEKGALPPQIAAQIAIRILSALQHAHSNGIIHRDIKPQNILVHSEGHIKVADFGIARVAGSSTLSKSDSVMGSVYYFSPEQAKGLDVTAASDLYSVGVVLYEMLTGQVPFDGDSPVAVAMQQINDAPRPMSEFGVHVPPAMEKVVFKAMEKSPDMRYQSALEMAQDLHRAMHEPEGDWLNSMQDQPIPMISQETGRQKPVRNVKIYPWVVRIISVILCLGAVYALCAGSVYIYNRVMNTATVPYVLDETEENAQKLCAMAGLKVKISRVCDPVKPAGTVLMQIPDVNTKLKKGETVLLTISTGPEEKPVPDIYGMQVGEARAILEKSGFSLLELPDRVLSNLPSGTVLNQEPAADQMLLTGSIVQVTLSGGCVVLPELTGMEREKAVQTLLEMGIKVEEIKEIQIDDPNLKGIVAGQQYMDKNFNPCAVGSQATQDTLAVLAVYTLAEKMPEETENPSSAGQQENKTP